ncbi:MAG: DUF1648 domain-containing protein [Bacilli bacterium]|jgi:hypothetical protein
MKKNSSPIERRNVILYYLNIFITINIILMALILFRAMDAVIPAHYDWAGNITRYGNKIEYLIIPATTLIFLSFSVYCYYGLIKHEHYKKGVLWCQIVILVFQLIIMFVTIWLGFRYISNIKDNVIPLITGLSFAFIFSIMLFSHPRFNPNKNVLYGVRTSFTLSNDIAWKKVNIVGNISGSTIILFAYLVTVITFKSWNVYLFSCIALVLVPIFVYHEILRKKLNSNK